LADSLSDSVAVPRELLVELHRRLVGVEEVLATLEEVMDKDGMKRIHRAETEYMSGEYRVVRDRHEVEKLIE
jgi:hypothetical protein